MTRQSAGYQRRSPSSRHRGGDALPGPLRPAQDRPVLRRYRTWRHPPNCLPAIFEHRGAEAAADAFVDRMVARAHRHTDPAEMLVECLAFTLERLPKERNLSLLVVPDRRASFTRNITSAAGFDLTNTLLSRLPVDWAAHRVGKP
jgi:hypothetical protein